MSSRTLLSTTVSVLSLACSTAAGPAEAAAVLGHASSRIEAATPELHLDASLHADHDRAIGGGEHSSIEEQQLRELKKIYGTSGTMPHRPPVSVDPAKRQHALPLNKKTALHPSGGNAPDATSLQNPATPYYPVFDGSGACLNDSAYPEHYLYDIAAYFSHSAEDCCRLHFEDVDHCMKAAAFESSRAATSMGGPNDGVGGAGGLGSGMGMKKEAYRSFGIYGSEMEKKMAEAKAANGGVPIGKKKPMMHHDTSWHAQTGWNGPSVAWHGGVDTSWHPGYSSKSGKADDSWHGGDIPWHASAKSAKAKYPKGAKLAKAKTSKSQEWWGPGWDASHLPPGDGGSIGGGSSGTYYHYCGISWADANSKCNLPCPSGTDLECPEGEACYADADACPPTVGGGEQVPAGPHSEWNGSHDGKHVIIKCEYPPEDEDDDWWGGTHYPTYSPTPGGDYWGGWEGGWGRNLQWQPPPMQGGWNGGWEGGWDGKAAKNSKDTKMDPIYHEPPPPQTIYHEPPPPPQQWMPPPPPQQWMPMPSSKSAKIAKAKSLKTPKSKSKKSAKWEYEIIYDPNHPSCFPSHPPTTRSPSASPVAQVPTPPTYAPTPALTYPTYAPTPNGTMAWPTYSPTTSYPTYSPTNKDTVSRMPTSVNETHYPSSMPSSAFPTFSPSTHYPTFSPTKGGDGTYPPTESGTHESPLDLCVWGNPTSISEPEGSYIDTPKDAGVQAIAASAGSRYSVVIFPTGAAYSAGYVDKIDEYQGHLGIRPQDVVKGQNMWQEITRVFDTELGGVTVPPKFKEAYAGVENTEGEDNIHTILLDGRGRAWAFGSNSAGQLCLGDTIDRMIPERIPLKGIVDVAVGGVHTLLLDEEGKVWACGRNDLGQLGLGKGSPWTASPIEVYTLTVPATSISAGKDHSLIVADDGLYIMGSNQYGALCVDTKGENIYTPQALDLQAKLATAFEATRFSSYILYSDGSVGACGRNHFGQLGDGSNDDAYLTAVAMPKSHKVVELLGVGPSAYSVFFGTKSEESYLMHEHAAAETIWATGLNDKGQLGIGGEENVNLPTLVKMPKGAMIYLISAGEDQSLALKIGGTDAIGTAMPTSYPTFNPTVAGAYPTYSPTGLTTYAPTKDGSEFYFWGAPEAVGQSGTDVTVPLNVGGAEVTFASAGCGYTIIILQDGSALSSGHVESLNEYSGHLGVEGVVEGVNPFKPISEVYDSNGDQNLINAPRFDKVFAGVDDTSNSGVMHTILLDNNGHVYATGANSKGQLCLGDKVDRTVPQKIPIEDRIVDVAIGGEHTLLLTDRGDVYGCGSNAVGQMGLGRKQEGSSPTKVDGLGQVSSISAGQSHSLFLASTGIYFTGSNEFGQLCSDTNGDDVRVPTSIPGIDINNVVSFEAIKTSSYILYVDGSVSSCGRNNFGQLGDGTNKNQLLAEVEMTGDVHVVRLLGVGPCAESVFFAADDGRVFGTGLNDRGQLGVGDTNNKNLPTRVQFEGLFDANLISVSVVHTVALGFISGAIIPTDPPVPFPTFSPTEGETTIKTPSPTQSVATPYPTSYPTFMPTRGVVATPGPTREGEDFFLWGCPEAVGQASNADVLTPLFVDEDAVYASAGSGYSLIVLRDGNALAAGFVESLAAYSGHLGLEGVVEGVNDFQPIMNVVDGDATAAPAFDKSFGGVENEAGSGVIHSILLDRQGRAYAVGSNTKGQLCLSDNIDRSIPERIPITDRIVDVAIGAESTLLLTEGGDVYGCGYNGMGQLGLGEGLLESSSPTLVEGTGTVSSISAGHSHSIFLSNSGVLFTGSNEFGALCTDTQGEIIIFTPQVLDIDRGVAVSIAAIKESSYILYEDGSVSACGRNTDGQLGDGTNQDQFIVSVELDDHIVRLLGAGPSAQSIFFVATDERVWGTGLNDRGQLGVGDIDSRNVPTQVRFGTQVLLDSISAGQCHTLALGVQTSTTPQPTEGAAVPPTQSPTYLVAVDAPTESPTYLVLVDAPTENPTYLVAVDTPTESPTFLMAVDTPTFSPTFLGSLEAANMYYWGAPDSVGEALTGDVTSPVSNGLVVSDVAAGSKYSIIVFADGTAQSAGFIESRDSYNGHLGLRGGDVSGGENPFQTITSVYDAENNVIVDAPFFVKAYAGAEQISSLGSMHSLLIDENGGAWVTGSNSRGQLCLGDFDDRLISQRVPIDGTVVSGAIGSEHTLLLLDDGSVYGCGSNEFGQVGLGDGVLETDTPTLVDGLGIVESLSAGLGFSLFKADDGLYVSGNNFYGQLCVDETVGIDVMAPYRITDVPVDTVASFEAIKTSSYILFNDGSVGACGRNNFGQLGDGSTIDRVRTSLDPIPGDLPLRILGVGPSSETVFFVNEIGVTYGTGLNDRGQLGVGDTDNRSTLTEVDFGNLVAERIAASGDHTLAICTCV